MCIHVLANKMDAKRKAVLIALLLKRGVKEKIILKKVAYIALANKLRKRRKSPDFWVHPILEERFRSYKILHEMMFKYPKKFKKTFYTGTPGALCVPHRVCHMSWSFMGVRRCMFTLCDLHYCLT